MLNALIHFSLQNRFLVILLVGVLVFVGVNSALNLPLDAFPDTTPNQVQINTIAVGAVAGADRDARDLPGRAVARRAEGVAGGAVGLEVRPLAGRGDLRRRDEHLLRPPADQRAACRTCSSRPGIERPQMGPVATGLGEIYHYYLTSDVYDLTELRTLHDWVVRPRLIRVPGVAEINTLGGFAKQYEVRVDPAKLAKYRLTFDDLTMALEQNNENVGGGPVDQAGQVHLVQGVGLVRTTRDIAEVVIDSINGVPIRVRDVGDVTIGHAIRRGGTTAHGKGRGRPRTGLHADGGELPGSHHRHRGRDGRRQEALAAGRRHQGRLQAART